MTVPGTVAFASALVLVPVVRAVARRKSWVCVPRKDRWSRKPVALCGGVAIFAAFLIDSLSLASGVFQLASILAPAAAMCLLGLVDDFIHLKPYVKFISQVAVASVAVYLGGGLHLLPFEAANILLSVFWVVAITNAMNLLDNMDGLSAGVGIIAALFLGAVFLAEGRPDLAAVAAGLAGALAGFLIFNFHPASIFMGDSGSLFSGFMLGALSLQTGSFHGSLGAVMVPALLLSVPLLDMTFVSVTRILRGRSIAQGGRDHTSHRLVSLGLSERTAVLVLYGLALASGAAAWFVSHSTRGLRVLVIPALIAVLSVVGIYLFDMTRSPEEKPDRDGGSTAALRFQFTFKRRIFEICLDMVLVVCCYSAAYLLRFDFEVPAAYLARLTQSLPLVIPITLSCLYFVGIYQGIWRFSGSRDVPRFFGGAMLAVLVNVLAMVLVYRFMDIPRSVFLVYGLLLFLAICLTRYSFKLIGQAVISMRSQVVHDTKVLIGGTGDGAEFILRQMLARNGRWNWKPIGFVDADADKKNLRIHGLPILGGWADLERIHAKHRFGQIIVAPDDVSSEQLASALAFCRERNIPLKRFGWVYEDLVQ